MTLPIRARHSFHHGQYLPPGSFHKLLSSSIRGQTECKPQSQKTKLITWITVLSNSVKLWGMPCRATQDGWWGVLTKCCPLEKGMANHFSILALRTHEQYEKAKQYDTERWTPQVGRYPIMLLEISGEITPERMKGWSQSKNNTQLWMGMVIEARFDVVKNNIT